MNSQRSECDRRIADLSFARLGAPARRRRGSSLVTAVGQRMRRAARVRPLSGTVGRSEIGEVASALREHCVRPEFVPHSSPQVPRRPGCRCYLSRWTPAHVETRAHFEFPFGAVQGSSDAAELQDDFLRHQIQPIGAS